MLLAVLAIGLLGWWHGRSMFELGRQQGRLDVRTEELEGIIGREQHQIRLLQGGKK